MAYVIEHKQRPKVPFLPLRGRSRKGEPLELDYARESDVEPLRTIFNEIVEEGMTYPQEHPLDEAGFKAYYMSHDVFVARHNDTGEVLGAFYVKPNFPGRCSHICNAGFIVKSSARGHGIGHWMGERFPFIGKALGYRASMFNLVFDTNKASLAIWRTLGFTELGVIPKAGLLKHGEYVDAHMFYYDFSKIGDTPPGTESNAA